MKRLLAIPAIAGLILTVVPALLAFEGIISPDTNKGMMLVGMLLWFGFWPFASSRKA